MAGIFANVDSDISKLRKLKAEIENVKKALKSINVKVDIDIAKGMEARIQSLTKQYDALVQKVAQAEAKVLESTARINQASDKIIKAQEQMAKAASGQSGSSAQGASSGNTASNNAQTASVEAQAKAYEELAEEIDAVMGTRSQNIRRMIEEQNSIRLINAEIKQLTKYQGENSSLTTKQQRRLEQLNASLLLHKTALSELRQSLNNSFKLDNAAATSMNALSQSLGRMRMAYRELTEEERKSPFGQELLASIQQADAKIKQLDATIGNHQRNVGNYASGWNGLNMSVQQIVRELPSAAMGLNMFGKLWFISALSPFSLSGEELVHDLVGGHLPARVEAETLHALGGFEKATIGFYKGESTAADPARRRGPPAARSESHTPGPGGSRPPPAGLPDPFRSLLYGVWAVMAGVMVT